MKAVLKEKAAVLSKEVARRGMDGGAERLRAQLRDAAQEGRSDEYGGDRMEDAAAGGLRRAEHGAERLLKKKLSGRSGQTDTMQATPEAPEHGTGRPPGGAAPPQCAAVQPAVKSKDAHIRGQAANPSPNAQAQVRRQFVRERGRKNARSAVSQRVDMPVRTVREMGVLSEQSRYASHAPSGRPRPGIKTGRPARSLPGWPGRRTVKTADHTAARSAGTAAQAVKQAAEAGRRLARTRKAAQTARHTTKRATQAAGRALRAMAGAAKSLLATIMAGGWVIVVIVLLICLIGMLIASPFGVFFSGEDSGGGYTMPKAVVLLNGEFTNRIEQIKADNSYDELDLDNAGSAAMVFNWDDVLAVYAVRTSTDSAAPEEVATLTEEKLSILRKIFWDMNAVSYWVETIPGEEDESDTTILHITVTIKDYLQMAEEYGFTAEQRELLAELMGPEYAELFLRLTGSYQDITLSPAEVREIIEKLPADLSEERRQVVLTAHQLLGRVNYFWGGKSLVLGWDSRWGTPMEVWADGSSTTGTMRPFGMDCSGYVDWVFYNATGGEYVIGHGGGASAQHSYCTDISWEEAIPGDLVFYPGDSHVGIVCGFDENGNVLIIHCASGQNNVVVTGKRGFSAIARPVFYSE